MLDISRRIHVHSGLIRFHLSVFSEMIYIALLMLIIKPWIPWLSNSFFYSVKYLSNIALMAPICLACASSKSFLRTSSWACRCTFSISHSSFRCLSIMSDHCFVWSTTTLFNAGSFTTSESLKRQLDKIRGDGVGYGRYFQLTFPLPWRAYQLLRTDSSAPGSSLFGASSSLRPTLCCDFSSA